MKRQGQALAGTTTSWLAGLLLLSGMMLLPRAALAAADVAMTAEERYQADRALCLSGLSHQERRDCLREAGAALEEARRGPAVQGSPEVLADNALRRCDRLPPADRPACHARVRGEGTVRGSVEGGGILQERREIIPAPAAPAPAAPAPIPAAPMPAPAQPSAPMPAPAQIPQPMTPPPAPLPGQSPPATLTPAPATPAPVRIAPVPPLPGQPATPIPAAPSTGGPVR